MGITVYVFEFLSVYIFFKLKLFPTYGLYMGILVRSKCELIFLVSFIGIEDDWLKICNVIFSRFVPVIELREVNEKFVTRLQFKHESPVEYVTDIVDCYIVLYSSLDESLFN